MSERLDIINFVYINEVQGLKMESASDSASGSSKFSFLKPSFSLFLPSIIIGKISVTGVHPSVWLSSSDQGPTMFPQHNFSAAAGTETSYC